MNALLKKKINLLVHLAKIDGRFDESERQVLLEMLRESGLSNNEKSVIPKLDPTEPKDVPSKLDILYWAIKMIKADNVIHDDEISFCKSLAIELGFESSIVDYLKDERVEAKDDFAKVVLRWKKSVI